MNLEETVIAAIRHGGPFSHRNITVKQTDGRTELFINGHRLYCVSDRYEAFSLYGFQSHAAQEKALYLLDKVKTMPVRICVQGNLCKYAYDKKPGTWYAASSNALFVYDKQSETIKAYLG